MNEKIKKTKISWLDVFLIVKNIIKKNMHNFMFVLIPNFLIYYIVKITLKLINFLEIKAIGLFESILIILLGLVMFTINLFIQHFSAYLINNELNINAYNFKELLTSFRAKISKQVISLFIISGVIGTLIGLLMGILTLFGIDKTLLNIFVIAIYSIIPLYIYPIFNLVIYSINFFDKSLPDSLKLSVKILRKNPFKIIFMSLISIALKTDIFSSLIINWNNEWVFYPLLILIVINTIIFTFLTDLVLGIIFINCYYLNKEEEKIKA